MLRSVFVGTLLLLPANVWSQTSTGELLTLEQALALALRANRNVENAALEVRKAEDSVAAVRTRRLPILHLGADGIDNLKDQSFTFDQGVFGTVAGTPVPAEDTQITAQSGGTGVLSASVKQPLSQQHRIGLNIERREVAKKLADQDLRFRRQEISKQVKQQYYGILKTQSALQATEETIVFYTELLRIVVNYVKQQVALEYESLDVQARLASSKHKAFTERNTLTTQKERMNELLGRDIATPFRVSAVSDAPVSAVDPAAAVDQALAQRPDVRAAQLKLQDAQLGYKVKKSEYVPEINLELRYTKLYNVELIPDELATVGIYGRWEFYDWGRKRRELAERSATIMQAENDQREVETRVAIEVNERIRKVMEEHERVNVAELQRKAAREKVRVLMNQYRVNAVLLKDVLQAQTELEDARNSYEHAVLALWTAKADLQKALGEE